MNEPAILPTDDERPTEDFRDELSDEALDRETGYGYTASTGTKLTSG